MSVRFASDIACVQSVLGGLAVLCLCRSRPSVFILSVCGAITHNFGQLLVINLLMTQSVYTLYYAPVLLLSGLGMGALTTLGLKALLPALEKLVIQRFQK